MSKHIAISDGVYRRLKQEKSDKSFSEVIAAHLDTGGSLADVAGQNIFAARTYDAVKREVRSLSDTTADRPEE